MTVVDFANELEAGLAGPAEKRFARDTITIAADKLREACSLLQECANVITVLHMMAGASFGDRDARAQLSIETFERISDRVRTISLRMGEFQRIPELDRSPHGVAAYVDQLRTNKRNLPSHWSDPLQLMEEFGRQREERIKVVPDPEVPGRVNITMPDPRLTPEELADIRRAVKSAVDAELLTRPLTRQEVRTRPWSPELANAGGLRALNPSMTREAAIKIARENFIKHNEPNLMPSGMAVWSASEWVIQAIIEASTGEAPPAKMSCGCPAGAHANHRNFLEGAAEREGAVCSLGWRK